MVPGDSACVQRLRRACPVYAAWLDRFPADAEWLQCPENRDVDFRNHAIKTAWAEMRETGGNGPRDGETGSAGLDLEALRRFRRRMSLRIAYREINQIGTLQNSFTELTLLAEFCLCRVLEAAWQRWCHRFGVPMCAEMGRPARYCVIGLGKLGGSELNFCSDLDLIYLYDGDGDCLKNGKATRHTTAEFMNRMFRQATGWLTERTGDSFLYNIDLRLRPEGASGPLVRTFAGMTHYYWSAGQTWERLAWLRARPVAGSCALGHELLEELNPFRYPRYPPPNLYSDIAGVKLRTQREAGGDASRWADLKNGPGGIREVEFLVQARQLLHGGAYPFLQAGATLEALARLTRYDILRSREAESLRAAYLALREVEGRVQMYQERQTHSLPQDAAARETLAETLCYPSFAALEAALQVHRDAVHQRYQSTFAVDADEAEQQSWTLFLAGEAPGPTLERKLRQWFPNAENPAQRLRDFALGKARTVILREQVALLRDLTAQFDAVLPRLARPLTALERVGQFAESYGSRKQFLKAAANPGLFRTLAMLFDRSAFIAELLCQYPGIMEELLHAAPLRCKAVAEHLTELRLYPDGDGLGRSLWLYTKAEQTRLIIAQLLHGLPFEAVEASLADLADAVLARALETVDPEGELAVIAMGKYGGRELAPGADLDLLLLAETTVPAALTAKAVALQRLVGHRERLGKAYELDLRLRPFGIDGSAVTGFRQLRAYHRAGHAQPWERQILTRARFAVGNAGLGNAIIGWVHERLYQSGLCAAQAEAIIDMRRRMEVEKTPHEAPDRAFKAGPGGLADVEVLAQMLQLDHGHRDPRYRVTATDAVLATAAARQDLAPDRAATLRRGLDHLRQVAFALGRHDFRPVSRLPDDPDDLRALAMWLNFEDADALLAHHHGVREEIRAIFRDFLGTSYRLECL